MGLKKLKTFEEDNREENKTFQFGPSFKEFRESKELCREENLAKYYQKTDKLYPEIIEHIVNCLVKENKEHFTLFPLHNGDVKLFCQLTQEEIYFNAQWELVGATTKLKVPFVDAFDALAMQVPEDLVIHHVPKGQLNPLKDESDKRDFASYIHLCHCNGWNAEWAIDKSFNFIHEGVERIEQIVPNAARMMLGFLNQNWRMERIAAISFKTSPYVNRHPADEELWVIPFNIEAPYLTSRVERQTVRGFPDSEAFLFTIRTYLYHLGANETTSDPERAVKRLSDAIAVFESPDTKSYAFDIIEKLKVRGVMEYLKKK